MNAGELIARARTRANISESDTQFTPAKLLELLNSSLRDVSLEHDWPWLYTQVSLPITAGTRTYTMPATWMRTLSLVDTDSGTALRRVKTKETDKNVGSGTPSAYSVFGTTLILSPTPTAADAITHRFVQTEPLLTSVSSIPLIPEAFAEVVIDRAAAKIAAIAGDVPTANGLAIDFAAGMKRLTRHLNLARDSSQVEIRPGSWF